MRRGGRQPAATGRARVIGLLVAGVAAALPAGRAAGQEATDAAWRDAVTRARIDSVFAPFTEPGSPGCAVGVYEQGRVAFARGYGLADLQHGTPITPRTPFTTGSLSKQFTAAAVAWLAREGRLSLDDPVRRWVPELDPMHDVGPVTVRQLVHHTSGMRDWWALVDLAGLRFDDGYRPDDVLALAARQRALNFAPGSAYAYSNTSYILLGRIVERASGASLRAFADSVFFRPLGMPVSRFLDDHTELIPGRAAAYSPRPGGGWRLNVWANDLVGQGGLVTTLEELQRWDENAYTGRVGGLDFVHSLEQPGRLVSDSLLSYAFGLEVGTWRGVREVSHTGSTGGYRSALFRYPTQRTSVALLCNTSTANTAALARRVAALVLGDVLAPEPPRVSIAAVRNVSDSLPSATLTPERRAALAGRWYSEELDVTWELRGVGDALQLVVPRRDVRTLRAVHADTLAAGDLRLAIAPGAAPSSFTASVGRVRGIVFERRR
jgi:CubicO group peptidase (beta-lactamase class C family)